MPDLHGAAADIGDLAQRVAALIGDRLLDPPLGRTATPREMQSALAGCITPEGLGIERSYLSTESWRIRAIPRSSSTSEQVPYACTAT